MATGERMPVFDSGQLSLRFWSPFSKTLICAGIHFFSDSSILGAVIA
jgi:hypothetical protein